MTYNGYHEEEVGNDSVNDDFDFGYHPEYKDDFSANENNDFGSGCEILQT